jgi:hypothetical protein
MSDTRPELSGRGHSSGRQRDARPGMITRLTIGVQWQTERGTTERYYALQLLQQYIRWEEMTEFLDGLEAICRQAQQRRDEHLPPERRLRWR